MNMKITVLADNNTLIDRYYLGEPALSLYIEDEDQRILFDTGYSDVFIRNAQALNIDLDEVDTIVISHGHNDHTGGLRYLKNSQARLIMHPQAEEKKIYRHLDISMPVNLKDYSDLQVIRTAKPCRISKHLTFLGQIEQTRQKRRWLEDDPLLDDSALVYDDGRELFIITGCSHSGIVNLCEQARKLTGISRIRGVLGGFHLLDDPQATSEVCEYFREISPEVLYPCHCTDLKAKIALSAVCPVAEVGVSSVIII